MRKILLSSMIMLIVGVTINAQVTISVKEEIKAISKGEKVCLTVLVPESDYKKVEKNWFKAIRNETKNKVEEENGEFYIYETIITKISSKPINIYSKVWDSKEGVQISVFFEVEEVFITSKGNIEKYHSAEAFLYDFAVENYKIAVEEDIDKEEGFLKDMEKDLDKLHRNKENFIKQIDKCYAGIRSTNSKIEDNLRNQDRKQDELHNQKDKLVGIKDKDALKEAEKTLKTFEKDLEKLRKKGVDLVEDISDFESDIRDDERDIVINEKDQVIKTDQIGVQKAVIQGLKTKMDNIK